MNHKIKQLNAKPTQLLSWKQQLSMLQNPGNAGLLLEDLHELRCITFLGVDVARRVTLVVAFDFLPHNFGKAVGIYKWYFVVL